MFFCAWKSINTTTQEQTIVYNRTQLDGITHEQTFISGQFFEGHTNEKEEKLFWILFVILIFIQ